MRYVRFKERSQIKYGSVEGDVIREIEGDIYGQFEITKRKIQTEGVKILPPCTPTKIPGVHLNFYQLAKDFNKPVPEVPQMFLKAPSSLIGHEDYIVIPPGIENVRFEGELAVIIKNPVKDISPEEVLPNVLGYTCFNDLTAHDIMKAGGPRCWAKSYDTFGPIGPYIVDGINPGNLKLELSVNGTVKQSSNTNDMIFSVEKVVSFLSKIMTLLPGDLIPMGTPPGLESVKPGDVIEVTIEKIGTLRNYVRSQD